MAPIAHAKALAATISGAHYTEFPSGHFALMECPDLFVKTTKDFLTTCLTKHNTDFF